MKNKKRAAPGEAQEWLKWALSQETDECLLWPFSASERKPKGRGGYGRISIGNGETMDVHRRACELAHGPAPAGDFDAAHRCGNRLCCNKRHLRWATPADNKADELIHGTRNRGERHGNAKLILADVLAIKAATDHPSIPAAIFGVSEASIRDIRTGRTWGWANAV